MSSVIPWIFILVAGAGLAYTAWSLWWAVQSESWPSAPGTILASKVEVDSASGGGLEYRAAVAYQYAVDGQKYAAERVHFGDSLASSWGLGLAQQEVNDHPTGSAVSVRYDPKKPARATLETGLRWYFLIDVLFWGAFLTVPVVILYRQH